jgi:hypothetical protein
MKNKILLAILLIIGINTRLCAQNSLDDYLNKEIELEDSIKLLQSQTDGIKQKITDSYQVVFETLEMPNKKTDRNIEIVQNAVVEKKKESIRNVKNSATEIEVNKLISKSKRKHDELVDLQNEDNALSDLIIKNNQLDTEIAKLINDSTDTYSAYSESINNKREKQNDVKSLKENLVNKSKDSTVSIKSPNQLLLYLYEENIKKLNHLLKGDFFNMQEVEAEKQKIPDNHFNDDVFENLRIKYNNYKNAVEYVDTAIGLLKISYDNQINYTQVNFKKNRILFKIIEPAQESILDDIYTGLKRYCMYNNIIYNHIEDNFKNFSKNNKSREQQFIDEYKDFHYEFLETEFWKFYDGVVNGKFNNINQCNIKKFICN